MSKYSTELANGRTMSCDAVEKAAVFLIRHGVNHLSDLGVHTILRLQHHFRDPRLVYETLEQRFREGTAL